jgi:YbbR domain-containing protein
MLKKLGKTVTNNFGLKILAILFAIILWIVVVGIDDPTTTLSYTTSISFSNQEYLTEQGKYFEPLDGSNTITFRVTAQRTIQEKLSNSDFTAVADLERIEYDAGSDSFRVPVVVSTSKYSSNQVTISSKQLYKEVAVEDYGKIQKQIVAETQGTVADGCALGDVNIKSSNLLKISGPYSIVSQIDKVVATISVDGLSTDATDVVAPVLYDADGNAIDTNKLTLSVNTVTITAQILNTKDVTLEFETEGEPENGYIVTGISYEPTNVRIKGEAAVLNTVSKITIPSDVLDVTGATENIETTVDISPYLASGTSLVLSSDATIKVTVIVEPVTTKRLEVPVENLTIENLKDGYTVKFLEKTFAVEISGAGDVIDALSSADIKGVVDASDLEKGEHYLDVTLTGDGETFQTVAMEKVAVSIESDKEE